MNINFNELILDNIGQWPLPVKYATAFIAAILITGLGYWWFVSPKYEEIKTLKQKEVELKSQFELKQQQAANLDAYKVQLNEINMRLEDMLRQLPAQNEMPALLEDISKTGVASGLIFELFAPQPEIIHDFYVELPIKIEVLGHYNQLAIFLSRVAQMKRIVTLHDFVITPFQVENATLANKPVAPSVTEKDLLEMKLIAKIYRYKT